MDTYFGPVLFLGDDSVLSGTGARRCFPFAVRTSLAKQGSQKAVGPKTGSGPHKCGTQGRVRGAKTLPASPGGPLLSIRSTTRPAAALWAAQQLHTWALSHRMA